MEKAFISNVCRCCLAQGARIDLNSAHSYFDKQENYAEMLRDCFGIVLSTSPFLSNGICDKCVSVLRYSWQFKQSVLHTEEELYKRAKDLEEGKTVEVKTEPKDESGDDSDNYFLAERMPEITVKKIKVEKPESSKKKTAQKKSKKITKTKAIDDFVSSLGIIEKSTSDGAVPHLTIQAGKIILPEMYNESQKVRIKWTSPRKNDRIKHMHNLETLLRHSNIVPFRKKAVVGYLCAYCEGTFPDPADLRTHTETEHNQIRLELQSDLQLFEYTLQVDITDLLCTICNESIEGLAALKEHLVKKHNKTIYTDIKDHIQPFKLKKGDVYDCVLCTAKYETFKMLKQHMNIHFRNYTCNKCNSSFVTRRSLGAHRNTHLQGSFKCDQCDKVFSSRAKKKYHEKTKHLGDRKISNCPYCNEPFKSYYQRNNHLIKVHNCDAQYKCNICDKGYVLKSLLMYHIKKSHLMERDIQCTECGYRFFSKKALKAHMVKHTGERNYECEICHKAYGRKNTLKEHMRIHNNDRRFKCEVCAMSFVQKCSLKSHLLSNHGISMQASDIQIDEDSLKKT